MSVATLGCGTVLFSSLLILTPCRLSFYYFNFVLKLVSTLLVASRFLILINIINILLACRTDIESGFIF